METKSNATQGGLGQEKGTVKAGERAEHCEKQGLPTLIDTILPNADYRMDEHIVVNAPPDVTYAALREVDFAQPRSPLLRLAAAIRIAGVQRIRRRIGLPMLATPVRLRLSDVESIGHVRLAEEPGREIVIGSVAQVKPYRPETMFTSHVTPSTFKSFEPPGYVKGAGSFQVRSFGKDRSLVSYEARGRATDDAARRRMFRALDLLQVMADLSIKAALRQVKRAAEERAQKRRGALGGPTAMASPQS